MHAVVDNSIPLQDLERTDERIRGGLRKILHGDERAGEKKPRLYNNTPMSLYHLAYHFYIVILGFTGLYVNKLFLLLNVDRAYMLEPPKLLLKNIDCEYSLEPQMGRF